MPYRQLPFGEGSYIKLSFWGWFIWFMALGLPHYSLISGWWFQTLLRATLPGIAAACTAPLKFSELPRLLTSTAMAPQPIPAETLDQLAGHLIAFHAHLGAPSGIADSIVFNGINMHQESGNKGKAEGFRQVPGQSPGISK